VILAVSFSAGFVSMRSNFGDFGILMCFFDKVLKWCYADMVLR